MIYGTREQIYREHEHIFTSYMRTYPRSLEVPCPSTVVPESLASRLRKIAHELMHYRWETTFSMADFEAAWKHTAIRVTMARTVVIGPKKGKIEAATPVQQKAGQAMLTVKNLGSDPEQTLMYLVHLHHIGAIEGGFTHIQGLPEEIALKFEARLASRPFPDTEFNVGFRRHPSEPGWLLN